MSASRISSVRPNELASLSDHPVHHGLSSQASESPALVPKDQGCARGNMRTCMSVSGHCSGINKSRPSSDNQADTSKYRTPSALHTSTLGVKRGVFSKNQSAVSWKTKRAEEDKGNEIECKQNPECSMCGDVGLRKQLFRCGKCLYRFQHTYCSNWYPKKRSYAGICNWCDTGDESGRKQTKRTENDCAPSQFKIPTDIEVEITKKKQSNLWSRGQRGDVRSRIRNSWKNELDMLVDAASVTEEARLESKSGNEVANVTVLTRPTSNSQADQPSDAVKVDGVNCKETSCLAKKIGRRYKFVVDVY